jgi:hypothetical protein
MTFVIFHINLDLLLETYQSKPYRNPRKELSISIYFLEFIHTKGGEDEKKHWSLVRYRKSLHYYT